jgi:hypothetical protein
VNRYVLGQGSPPARRTLRPENKGASDRRSLEPPAIDDHVTCFSNRALGVLFLPLAYGGTRRERGEAVEPPASL